MTYFLQCRMCHWVWQKEVSEAYSSHVVICSSLICKTPQETDPVQPRAPLRIWANLCIVSFGVPLNLLNSSIDLWAWQWQALLRHLQIHGTTKETTTVLLVLASREFISLHLSSNPPRKWDQEITGLYNCAPLQIAKDWSHREHRSHRHWRVWGA